MSFQNLSTEIVLHIISYVGEESPLEGFSLHTDIKQISDRFVCYESRMKCLSALLLCNRLLQSLVEPYLYSRVVITKLEKLISFDQTISKRSDLASHVRNVILIEDVLNEIPAGSPLYVPISDYSVQWDRLSEDILPRFHNLQSFSFERITPAPGKPIRNPLRLHTMPRADILSDGGQNSSPPVPEHLSSLTLSYKGGGCQIIDPRSIYSFLKLQSAISLHLYRLDICSGPPWEPASLKADFLSPLKELRLSSCAISIPKFGAIVCLLPHLERFSYQYTALEHFTHSHILEEVLLTLLPARDSLQELRISSEKDYQPHRFICIDVLSLPSLLAKFSVLTSLSIDAAMLPWTPEAEVAHGQRHGFLPGVVQPSIRHLMLYQCDFKTYIGITELAGSKTRLGLTLQTIQLQFHLDFPHWPSFPSLTEAHVLENLAVQTKAIEMEYEDLARGRSLSSTPVTGSGALPDRLVPMKEEIAREVCESNGILLDVRQWDPFLEAKEMRKAKLQRRYLALASLQED